MKRILNIEAKNYLNQKVKVAGWVSSRRDHGKLVFLDSRDRSGILQVVCPANLIKDVKEEFVLEIEGLIQQRPKKMVNPHIETGEIELNAEKVRILAKAQSLPFDLKDLKLSLPKLLDWRPLSLRNHKIAAIFKVQEHILTSFRNTLKKLDFTEFQAPVIVPSNAEGGAQVFHIDYYNYDAYLAQSPQLYKQIMLAGFERVFTINRVFRAEPSVTTRHLSEYSSLDVEMAFIESWQDLMDVCETIIKEMFYYFKENCQNELKLFNASFPAIGKSIPRIKMREAQQIIFERTGRDNRQETDLSPEDEKEICNFTKEKYDSEFVFITHYPTKKRPFYTEPDPLDKDYTLSFDILCRGLEITTGGQRINDYQKLIKNIKKWNNNPKDFAFYLQNFKYGIPPEGGFAFGLERLTKQILGLENIREATIFVRDTERIDLSLSKTKSNLNTLKRKKFKNKK